MFRRTPTQVTEWRGGEWDSFVNIQPAFANPGYGAGFSHDPLPDRNTDQLSRREYHTRESPSLPHRDSLCQGQTSDGLT
jgi:hypothetical protein